MGCDLFHRWAYAGMAALSRQAVLPAARKGGRAVVCLWTTVAVIAPVQAGNFLNLSQVPPGAGFKGPAPNVIISVDDSGSMGTVGMEALRTALQETFRPENVPDGSIRLAYQSMTLCNSIPSASPGCDNLNYMQPLVGNYDPAENSARGRFLRWVNTLTSTDSTPTHHHDAQRGGVFKNHGHQQPLECRARQSRQQPAVLPQGLPRADDRWRLELFCRRSHRGWRQQQARDLQQHH